jgi:hypothetical protein
VNEGYDRVAQVEATEHAPERWAGTLACCLAHHRKMFWMAPWKSWVHSDMRSCESMEGEPDPNALPCRYCGARLQVDGAGRLWSLVPKADRSPGWEAQPGAGCYCTMRPGEACSCPRLTWRDDAWTEKCPVSPTFRHEVSRMRFT